MAKPHQRAVALIFAIIFLGTSVAAGGAVVFQILRDNSQNKTANTADTKNTTTNTPQEGKLQGTKLQNFEPLAAIDKLQSLDLKEGSGETVKPGAKVKVHYTGATAKDGVIFQSSHDTGEPIEFPLDQVIKGWTEGVQGMKVGGTRRLLIPYAQAYGEAGRPEGGIPAKADLVFDIELISVTNP
jgi:FKBP-type peptidyl-prolyl cis-trans isomerase